MGIKEEKGLSEQSKLDEDVVKKLEHAFSIDASVEEACFYANISRQTYYNWVNQFPDLQEKFDRLRHNPILKARQTVISNLGQPETAKWYLERKVKKEFASKQEIDLTDKREMEEIEKQLKQIASGEDITTKQI